MFQPADHRPGADQKEVLQQAEETWNQNVGTKKRHHLLRQLMLDEKHQKLDEQNRMEKKWYFSLRKSFFFVKLKML